MDPCDFRKLHTVDELREFVDNNEISLIDYMISTIDEDVSTAAGRSRYVARGAEILSHVSDGVIFDNCVKLLALESLSSLSTVREAVGKVDEVSDNFSLADPDDDVALAFVRLGARLWPDALRRSVDVLPSDLARFVTEMGDGVLVAEDFSFFGMFLRGNTTNNVEKIHDSTLRNTDFRYVTSPGWASVSIRRT